MVVAVVVVVVVVVVVCGRGHIATTFARVETFQTHYATQITSVSYCLPLYTTSSTQPPPPSSQFQIVERNGDVHAEYLVVVGLGHVTFGVWRRFSQVRGGSWWLVVVSGSDGRGVRRRQSTNPITCTTLTTFTTLTFSSNGSRRKS